jgi:hypothetical protein
MRVAVGDRKAGVTAKAKLRGRKGACWEGILLAMAIGPRVDRVFWFETLELWQSARVPLTTPQVSAHLYGPA